MATPLKPQILWRPRPTGNREVDQAFRKVFDFIYSPRGSGPSSVSEQITNVSQSVSIATGGGGGGGGGGTYPSYLSVTPSSGAASFSLSGVPEGSTFEILANASTISINPPTGGTSGQHFWVVLLQGSSGGTTFSWTGGAWRGVSDQSWLDTTPSVDLAIEFVVRPDGNFMAVTGPYASEAY